MGKTNYIKLDGHRVIEEEYYKRRALNGKLDIGIQLQELQQKLKRNNTKDAKAEGREIIKRRK